MLHVTHILLLELAQGDDIHIALIISSQFCILLSIIYITCRILLFIANGDSLMRLPNQVAFHMGPSWAPVGPQLAGEVEEVNETVSD